MSNVAFDTLGAARKLKASGLAAEQSETIVEVVSQSTSQFVTVEHFDAGIETVRAELRGQIDSVETRLSARIDKLFTKLDAVQTGLNAKIDKVRADLQAEIARSILIAAGVITAAVGLMLTVLGILLANGLLLPLPPS